MNLISLYRTAAMFLALFLTCATLAQPLTAAPPLDPARLMQGFPPPPTYQVNIANWQAYPQKIWAFQHVRELFPTRLLPHTGPVQPLPHALKTLDELVVSAKGESRMTWPEMLKVTHTDAIVVLYHGRIIYERYFNNMAPESRHLLFSATKSMAGLMAATLVSEGKLDENAKVSDIIPELAESAWADATVRQVMDMTDGVAFSENYTDPKSDIYRYAAAMGWAPQFKNPTDPDGILPMLATLKAQRDERGSVFRYHSPATDVAAWLAMRAAGQSLTAWLTDRLWSKLGMEADGDFLLDPKGTEVAFAGLSLCIRDLARVGQMLLQKGRYNNSQVIPAGVVEDIARGADAKAFEGGGFKTRKGWSYRSQWWVNPNFPRSFGAHGAFGQLLYVFPEHDLVIAKFGSHPNPLSSVTDPVHFQAFAALIQHLQLSVK